MPLSSEPGPAPGSVALFLLSIFLLCTPFTDWWLMAGLPWYTPFLGWLGMIVAAGLVIHRGGRRGV